MSIIRVTLTKVDIINMIKGINLTHHIRTLLAPEFLSYTNQRNDVTWNKHKLNSYSPAQLFTMYQALKGNDIAILKEYTSTINPKETSNE